MVASQNVALTGGTMFRLRVADGRSVADAVRALEAEKLGVAQPNYVFKLQQDPKLAARTQSGELDQYVVNKLRLGEVHRVATGSNVLVAVIHSEIDSRHPDLAGAFVERFDAVGRPDKPHVHGTGMAGAIAAHRQLMGIAPGARFSRSMPSARMRANCRRRPPSTFSPGWIGRSARARASST